MSGRRLPWQHYPTWSSVWWHPNIEPISREFFDGPVDPGSDPQTYNESLSIGSAGLGVAHAGIGTFLRSVAIGGVSASVAAVGGLAFGAGASFEIGLDQTSSGGLDLLDTIALEPAMGLTGASQMTATGSIGLAAGLDHGNVAALTGIASLALTPFLGASLGSQGVFGASFDLDAVADVLATSGSIYAEMIALDADVGMVESAQATRSARCRAASSSSPMPMLAMPRPCWRPAMHWTGWPMASSPIARPVNRRLTFHRSLAANLRTTASLPQRSTHSAGFMQDQ